MPESELSELNVLLLSSRFEVRGSSAYTLRLAEKLSEHGVNPRVACPDARLVNSELRARLPIREYPHMGVPLWGRLVMQSLRRDAADPIPDLIHVQSRTVLAQGTWLARRLKRPMVLTIHDYLHSHERVRFDQNFGTRIIAVSQSVKSELLQRIRLDEKLVTISPGGVHVEQSVDTLPVLDPGHVPVIGTAGPLEAIKGVPFFLGAARKVLDQQKNVEFLVSGAGPEEGNLRRLARELNIAPHVTFVPNLLDFSKSLAAMDIFCLPSLRQALGTIMLEAMALGKPVIASGVGGVYSVVRNNETGLVVPPSNSGELAKRMLELLNDPVRARVLGEAGRIVVRDEFSVEKMVRQTADLYREVLAESCTRN